MIKILFIRNEKAFYPEINAYVDYFNKNNAFKAFDSSKIQEEYSTNDFDVLWEFKGIGGLKTKNILIHEYPSLSVGPVPKLKNIAKRKLNVKPELRIFLNEHVKDGFKFADNIEYCYRDMGIDEKFIKIKNVKKEYEFLYVGSICKERGIDKLLKRFGEKAPGKLCLIGNVEDELYREYKFNKNIIFIGRVDYADIPVIASKAVYGVNFIPDKYPYNIQTSTKLLEYLALELKVITTDYLWVRKFEKKHGCNFYKINPDISNINIDNLDKYEFVSNFQPRDFLWDTIIDKSCIKEKLLHISSAI